MTTRRDHPPGRPEYYRDPHLRVKWSAALGTLGALVLFVVVFGVALQYVEDEAKRQGVTPGDLVLRSIKG